MRRHIAAKFVHLFAFGTVSLVKQLQAWFISAPPDKEPKHWLMMPNHVSTLPGSSSATKVIHIPIDQLYRRACHPQGMPAHRLVSQTVGRWQTNRVRDGVLACFDKDHMTSITRFSTVTHVPSNFFQTQQAAEYSIRSTRPTRIKPVRPQSFSAPQLHIVPSAKCPSAGLPQRLHPLSIIAFARLSFVGFPVMVSNLPKVVATPENSLSLFQMPSASPTCCSERIHINSPPKLVESRATHVDPMQKTAFLIFSSSMPDASTRPTQTKLVRSQSRQASLVMLHTARSPHVLTNVKTPASQTRPMMTIGYIRHPKVCGWIVQPQALRTDG